MIAFTADQLAVKRAAEARANTLTIAAATSQARPSQAGAAGAELPPSSPRPQSPQQGGQAPIASATAAATPGGAQVPAGASGTPSLFDYRATDPDTSRAAADSITPDRRRDIHARVLTLLLDGPLSDFDLAARTGLKQTSVGKRRHELCGTQLVVEYDRAGISDTGSACIRWALTDAGYTAARHYALEAAS